MNNKGLLYLSGKNLNDIYTLRIPESLLQFCRFDFSVFTARCNELRAVAMKSGELPLDEMIQLRNSISGCHIYYEKNIRSVFQRIVTDCWIDALSKQTDKGTTALWNSLIGAKTPYEKELFSRLSEYRNQKAINQYTNLIRLQNYAKTKLEFVFGKKVNGISDAKARANLFDLMLNVTCNELGMEPPEQGLIETVAPGRMPNAPFVLSSVSKEILKGALKHVPFEAAEGLKKNHVSKFTNPALFDKQAMQALSFIEPFLPSHSSNVTTALLKAMNALPDRVYFPKSFKAVLDLEFDVLMERGGILQRCKRCQTFFLKSDEYPHDYCSTPTDGKTCLEIMSHIEPKIPPREVIASLNEKYNTLYSEMAARVNIDITQRDFHEWYQYLLLIRDNVMAGKASMEDFDSFAEYSRSIRFVQSKPKDEEKVRPFVFERVDKNEAIRQGRFIGKDTDDSDETEDVIASLLFSNQKKEEDVSISEVSDTTPADVFVPMEFQEVVLPSSSAVITPSDSLLKEKEAEPMILEPTPKKASPPPELKLDSKPKKTRKKTESKKEKTPKADKPNDKPPSSPPPKNTRVLNAYKAASGIPSATTKDEPNFADLLVGIEYQDGFEKEETGDGGHKTKRLMDAILKPSAPSPVIKLDKKEKDA